MCSNVAFLAKGKCHTCYEFFRRNGFDKDILQKKDVENDLTTALQSMVGKMTLAKAQLIRKLHDTKMYSQRFLSEKAGISYLNDIVSNRYFKV